MKQSRSIALMPKAECGVGSLIFSPQRAEYLILDSCGRVGILGERDRYPSEVSWQTIPLIRKIKTSSDRSCFLAIQDRAIYSSCQKGVALQQVKLPQELLTGTIVDTAFGFDGTLLVAAIPNYGRLETGVGISESAQDLNLSADLLPVRLFQQQNNEVQDWKLTSNLKLPVGSGLFNVGTRGSVLILSQIGILHASSIADLWEGITAGSSCSRSDLAELEQVRSSNVSFFSEAEERVVISLKGGGSFESLNAGKSWCPLSSPKANLAFSGGMQVSAIEGGYVVLVNSGKRIDLVDRSLALIDTLTVSSSHKVLDSVGDRIWLLGEDIIRVITVSK